MEGSIYTESVYVGHEKTRSFLTGPGEPDVDFLSLNEDLPRRTVTSIAYCQAFY